MRGTPSCANSALINPSLWRGARRLASRHARWGPRRLTHTRTHNDTAPKPPHPPWASPRPGCVSQATWACLASGEPADNSALGAPWRTGEQRPGVPARSKWAGLPCGLCDSAAHKCAGVCTPTPTFPPQTQVGGAVQVPHERRLPLRRHVRLFPRPARAAQPGAAAACSTHAGVGWGERPLQLRSNAGWRPHAHCVRLFDDHSLPLHAHL